jgi:two-component system nitrate/nitrite response regulator NarL
VEIINSAVSVTAAVYKSWSTIQSVQASNSLRSHRMPCGLILLAALAAAHSTRVVLSASVVNATRTLRDRNHRTDGSSPEKDGSAFEIESPDGRKSRVGNPPTHVDPLTSSIEFFLIFSESRVSLARHMGFTRPCVVTVRSHTPKRTSPVSPFDRTTCIVANQNAIRLRERANVSFDWVSAVVTNSSATTSVSVVADVRLYREGLAASLAAFPGISVVGTCADRTTARQQVSQLRPDVVLIDVATRESLELIRDLRSDGLGCKALAFAVEEVAAEILECAEAGAAGYVTADASIEDLVRAIERIGRSELVCSPHIAAHLFGRISERGEVWSLEAKTLTPRERQVLDCIREGQSNKEIAQKLNIAEPTVKNHVHHLLEKLDVTTRAQAAARATLSSGRRQPFGTRAVG